MKKQKYIFIVSIVFVCGIILCGSCKSNKKSVGAAKYDFVVKKGDTIAIELETNPSTGYQWSLTDTLDSGVVSLLEKSVVKDTATSDESNKFVGKPRKIRWNFKATEQGITTIPLKYSRPWEESDSTRKESYKIKVTE